MDERTSTDEGTASAPVVVLDDDPTGAQLVERARVLLAWTPAAVAAAAEAGARTIHLVTNSRALDAEGAYAVTRDAVRAARAALPDAPIVLRGDSTLRGHVRAEYEALRDAAHDGRDLPLLLAMALPSAGRVTRDGVHLLARDGAAVPLSETEYARDPAFAYRDARLLAWAHERSDGLLDAARGREVRLAELRTEGAATVERALTELAGAGPAACAVDAETLDDLALAAQALVRVRASGTEVAVRCAPAFPAVLAGNLARGAAAMPAARGAAAGGARGVLLVCGSYVPATTRQLAAVAARWPDALVEADAPALAGADPTGEQRRLASELRARLDAGGVAALATPRALDARIEGQAGRERLARNLAAVLRLLDPPPAVVIAKGGITSAVTLPVGLGTDAAEVVGPVAPGVSLWRPLPGGDAPASDGAPAYVVVPGNVGDDDLLVRLVAEAAA